MWNNALLIGVNMTSAFKTSSSWTTARHVSLSSLSLWHRRCQRVYEMKKKWFEVVKGLLCPLIDLQAFFKGQMGNLVCPYLASVSAETWWKRFCGIFLEKVSPGEAVKDSNRNQLFLCDDGIVPLTGFDWKNCELNSASRECLRILKFTVCTYICLIRMSEPLFWPNLLWFRRKTVFKVSLF